MNQSNKALRDDLGDLFDGYAYARLKDKNLAVDDAIALVTNHIKAEMPVKKTMDAAYKSGSGDGWGCITGFNEAVDKFTQILKEMGE